MQLDMFPELLSLNANVQSYKDSSDKVRRGVFARIGDHKKQVDERFSQYERDMQDIKHLLEEMRNLIEFSHERVC